MKTDDEMAHSFLATPLALSTASENLFDDRFSAPKERTVRMVEIIYKLRLEICLVIQGYLFGDLMRIRRNIVLLGAHFLKRNFFPQYSMALMFGHSVSQSNFIPRLTS